jgi:Eukaryotic initiation factor 4E
MGSFSSAQPGPSGALVDTINPKTPLKFAWIFCYIKPDEHLSWQDKLVDLIDIGFVEDFWATFNKYASPSRLSQNESNSDYDFF